MVLENINSPEDVKKLSLEELNLLGGEMREALLHRLSNHGGHFGPNFGMVEATIALHYVFNSPEDKIVFDVSHQSYPHKMLTGRKEAYLDPEKYDDVSGYSEPSESAHDHFVIGHTSTSVSLAGGLAKGRDLKGEKGNVIAVIAEKLSRDWTTQENWTRTSSSWSTTTRCPSPKTTEACTATCRSCVKAKAHALATSSRPWDWITCT